VRSTTTTPPPRGGDAIDSSDEEDAEQDELITGFDNLGAQRCVPLDPKGMQLFQLTKAPSRFSAHGERRKPNASLVIPALKNKDWREVARKRRSTHQFIPSSAKTGKDGSVGGLGTRETINSGPVLSGLQIKKKVVETLSERGFERQETTDIEMVAVEVETDDQKALRAILAESAGETLYEDSAIDVIPTPISEADALKQDVEELPDPASLEDYSRVPVSQFGAALLRGMGWKEGTAASRKPGKGLVEPYLPVARPALLGIGAKEQEIHDDGSGKDKKTTKRPSKRYVPVVKQERSGTSTPLRDGRARSRSPRRSAGPSRRSSRSPERDDRNLDSRSQGRDERREDDRNRRRQDSYRSDQDRRRDDGREREHGDERQHRRRDDEKTRRREDERDRSQRRKER
jgi:hypothetical protein